MAVITVLSGGSLLADTIFNFDNVPAGQVTPFSDSQNGIVATFTAIPEPDIETDGGVAPGWIGPEGFDPTAPGQFLRAGFRNSLDIVFNQDLNRVILDYAVFAEGGISYFSLDAFEKGTRVGGDFQFGSEGGVIGFSGANFNELFLADVNHESGIDNVQVSVAPEAIPEPATLGLVALCLLSFGVMFRKRRVRRSFPEP
jgi:hypothetical protein